MPPKLKNPVLTRAAVRELDRLAVERFGISSIVLMENAAIGLAAQVLAATKRTPKAPILILCGPGNNGGDGFAAARHLANAGREVKIVAMTRKPTTDDARTNLRVVEAMGLPLVSLELAPDVLRKSLAKGRGTVVECLFGTGLSRPLAGPALDAVHAINTARARWRIIAADVPAGLDADTGEPLGNCVRAHLTVTFAALKPGLVIASAKRWTGRVVVAPIGAPNALIRELALRR